MIDQYKRVWAVSCLNVIAWHSTYPEKKCGCVLVWSQLKYLQIIVEPRCLISRVSAIFKGGHKVINEIEVKAQIRRVKSSNDYIDFVIDFSELVFVVNQRPENRYCHRVISTSKDLSIVSVNLNDWPSDRLTDTHKSDIDFWCNNYLPFVSFYNRSPVCVMYTL